MGPRFLHQSDPDPGVAKREDYAVTEPIPEAEAFIRFRLEEMAERNEHHKFEEVATRIARNSLVRTS